MTSAAMEMEDGSGVVDSAANTKVRSSNSSGSSGNSDVSLQTRANPLTVEWLLEHFEGADGVCLPRSTIFSHYLRHCQELHIETMNAATFGKAVRSIFTGLKSRRLGTRGQSRYHYYGLSIKATSPLNAVACSEHETRPKSTSRSNRSLAKTATPSQSATHDLARVPSTVESSSSSISPPPTTTLNSSFSLMREITPNNQPFPRQRAQLPDLLLNDIQWQFLEQQVRSMNGYPVDEVDVRAFRQMYKRHCELVLENAAALKFANIEHLWAVFWRARYEEETELHLPFAKLLGIVSCPPVQDVLIHIDVDFFNTLTRVLIPDVLSPLPSSLTQSIRNFAKSMEGWMRDSMNKMPRRLVHHRTLIASAMAQSLRRYTSLNHLAQAARTVLTNLTQTDTMLSDISRLDISAIHEQGSLMCPCDLATMKRFSDEFKLLLADRDASERWPLWIDCVLDAVVGQFDKQSAALKCQQFCQQWSYFSSLFIRDLTLRSAASFGSFHLIRLLFDEYVVYAIEQRSARRCEGMSPLRQFYEHLLRLYPHNEHSGSPGRPMLNTVGHS